VGEQVIVVRQEVVKDLEIPEGLVLLNGNEIQEILEAFGNCYLWEDRDLLEGNPLYRQIIPYPVIMYKDRIFSAVRNKRQEEHRLHGKASIGFGGHTTHLESDGFIDLLTKNAERELHEELILPEKIGDIEFDGFINDLYDPVGQDHLGIFIVINVNDNVEIKEISKFQHGRFSTIKELVDSPNELERWSVLVIEALEKYYSSL
jgi:predicted NUDIX family phosphoesterase